MSKRSSWTFSYEVPILFAAAQSKRVHHEGRVAFWNEELKTADAKLREKGVEFRDMPVTGGVRTDAVLDPQLSARVGECRGKVREHESKRDDYARWEKTFAKASQPYLELEPDDIAYFGVAEGNIP